VFSIIAQRENGPEKNRNEYQSAKLRIQRESGMQIRSIFERIEEKGPKTDMIGQIQNFCQTVYRMPEEKQSCRYYSQSNPDCQNGHGAILHIYPPEIDFIGQLPSNPISNRE